MAIVYGSSGDIRLSFNNASEVEISAAAIALGRTRATDLINGYVAKGYPQSVPFTTEASVPSLLNSLANDLAIYYIKRDVFPGPMPLSAESKEEYWDKPISILEKISSKDIELFELISVDSPNISATGGASGEPYSPTFGEGDELTWEISPTKLEDEANNRDE